MHGKTRSQTVINITILVSIVGILYARFSGANIYNPGKQINIRIKDYDERWPFQIDDVILACASADTVTLINPETRRVYALSQAALAFGGGWDNYQLLLRPGASEEVVAEILKRGLKLCPPPRF